MCAEHVSTRVEELDVLALKCPLEHASHVGCSDADPTFEVNLPAPHFVCAEHVSTCVEEPDVLALNRPLEHASHVGCSDADPTFEVNLPGPHFVCASHLSTCVDELATVVSAWNLGSKHLQILQLDVSTSLPRLLSQQSPPSKSQPAWLLPSSQPPSPL